MIVFAFMRQTIAKTYGLEIENGLIQFYRLDFLSCLSQWIYVVEGYCRQLFAVPSKNNVKFISWTIPTTGDAIRDGFITSLSTSLGTYLDNVFFKSSANLQSEYLRRHVILHGNQQNKDFFSQRNCLLLMFILDALVVIEMASNKQFPQVFQERPGEPKRITQRSDYYLKQLQYAFSEDNLQRLELQKQHF